MDRISRLILFVLYGSVPEFGGNNKEVHHGEMVCGTGPGRGGFGLNKMLPIVWGLPDLERISAVSFFNIWESAVTGRGGPVQPSQKDEPIK